MCRLSLNEIGNSWQTRKRNSSHSSQSSFPDNSICLFLCLFLSLHLHLSLYVHLSPHLHFSLQTSICLSTPVSLSTHPYLSTPLFLSPHLHISLFTPICVTLSWKKVLLSFSIFYSFISLHPSFLRYSVLKKIFSKTYLY